MKRLFLLLLATSLSANAWLLWRPSHDGTGSLQPANLGPRDEAAAPHGRSEHVASNLAPVALLKLPETDDLTGWRDNLRHAGFDEMSVRALVEGALRQRFREKAAAWRIERWRTAWWRGGVNAPGAPSARDLLDEPQQRLLGRDPLDVTDAELRYDFLPPDKRRLLAEIDLDYGDLQSLHGRGNAPTRAEFDESQLLERERQKDVLAALTPEQRAEYELRFGPGASIYDQRFAAMDATESEFRAIKAIIAQTTAEKKALPTSAERSERLGADQRAFDQLVTAIGYDRAIEYAWADGGGPYADAVAVVRRADLPRGNAAQLLQLSAETGVRATAIHYDASLTVEQKRAALLALQQDVRPRLDTLVPPAIQPQLSADTLSWFTMLADGRYARPQPMFGSRLSPPTASVASPPSGAPPVVPMPRRSGP